MIKKRVQKHLKNIMNFRQIIIHRLDIILNENKFKERTILFNCKVILEGY